VANFPLRQEAQGSEGPPAANALRLLYHGSIVPARVPLAVIDALSMLPASVTLMVVGYETVGSRGYVNTLKGRARDLGVEDRLTVKSPMPRADLLQQCARCDVGLALVPLQSNDFNEQTMVGASNKPFDYMACGLALIVSDLPTWRATFVDPGYALSCNPTCAQSIAVAIEQLLAEPQLRRSMGGAGRAKILEMWNYDDAFAPVFTVLNDGMPSGATLGKAEATQTAVL
jgi:glycosyltransferase involved in cell wall biosynthesis